MSAEIVNTIASCIAIFSVQFTIKTTHHVTVKISKKVCDAVKVNLLVAQCTLSSPNHNLLLDLCKSLLQYVLEPA